MRSSPLPRRACLGRPPSSSLPPFYFQLFAEWFPVSGRVRPCESAPSSLGPSAFNGRAPIRCSLLRYFASPQRERPTEGERERISVRSLARSLDAAALGPFLLSLSAARSLPLSLSPSSLFARHQRQQAAAQRSWDARSDAASGRSVVVGKIYRGLQEQTSHRRVWLN